jgi:hypothetical protein
MTSHIPGDNSAMATTALLLAGRSASMSSEWVLGNALICRMSCAFSRRYTSGLRMWCAHAYESLCAELGR